MQGDHQFDFVMQFSSPGGNGSSCALPTTASGGLLKKNGKSLLGSLPISRT